MKKPKIIEKDRKLLAALHDDGRTSHKQLGKAMRASSETARYRLNRLREKGVLEGVVPIVDMNRVGYTTYRVQIRFDQHDEERKQAFKTFCEEQPETSWIVDIAGDWDFVALLQTDSIKQFESVYRRLLERYGDLIGDRRVTIVTSITHLPPTYITKREGTTYRTGLNEGSVDISGKQRRILEMLLADGRRKLSTIAKELDLSISTVRYHIDELEDKAVIAGYKPVINAERLGFDHYKLMFELEDPSQTKQLKRRFRKEENLIYITETLGTYDIECEGYYQRVNNVIRFIESIKQETGIKEFTMLFDNDETLINALPE